MNIMYKSNLLSQWGTQAYTIVLPEARHEISIDTSDCGWISLAECYCRVNNYKLLEQVSSLLHEQGRDKEALQKIELRALIQQKRMEDAEKLLKQMNGVKEDSEFVLLRALCELAAGRRATAAEMAQKAVELDPKNREAIELQRFLSKEMEIRK